MLNEKKNIFVKIKNYIFSAFKDRDPAKVFISIMGIATSIYLLASLISAIFGGKLIFTIFFARCKDLFADMFNSLRDVAQGMDVYAPNNQAEGGNGRGVIYPPLANVIFYLLALFIPREYLNSEFGQLDEPFGAYRYSWVNYWEAILFSIVLVVLSIIGFIFVFKNHIKLSKKASTLFLTFIIISAPILYIIERLNIMILCVYAVSFFVFNYNSDSKIIRELSIIAFAFSIGLKIYPVVFGFVLLKEKKYKEILRCIIYSLILLLLPTIFYGGPGVYLDILKNIGVFSNRMYYEDADIFSKLFKYLIIAVMVLACIFYLYIISIKQPTWKMVAVAVACLCCVTSIHQIYMSAFLIAPLILFCKTEKLKGFNIWYFTFIMCGLIVVPDYFRLNFFDFGHPMFESFLLIVSNAGLILTAVIETFVVRKKNRAEKKLSLENKNL